MLGRWGLEYHQIEIRIKAAPNHRRGRGCYHFAVVSLLHGPIVDNRNTWSKYTSEGLVSYSLRRSWWQFPKELEEAALGVVHHSVLPLEELVEEVHCRISSPSGTSDKENATGQKPAKAAPSKTAFSHDSIRSWIASVSHYTF